MGRGIKVRREADKGVRSSRFVKATKEIRGEGLVIIEGRRYKRAEVDGGRVGSESEKEKWDDVQTGLGSDHGRRQRPSALF